MRRFFLLPILFPSLFFTQKEPDYFQCHLKSLTTICNENSRKVISEISSDRGIKIYGRFNDVQKGLSERALEKYRDKINFNCSEEIGNNSLNQAPYSQKSEDSRPLYDVYGGSSSKIIYKGTENIKGVKDIDLHSTQKYLQLYRNENENDRNYEASYHYYDSQDHLIYTFHQHGNEFDEYVYFYADSFYGTVLSEVYKNGTIFEEYSYTKEENTYETKIIEYNIDKSYQLDKKNRSILKKSSYINRSNHCSCKDGYTTTIVYWDYNKCASNIILE